MQPGQTLDGKYRILRQLGEGGMGQVFLVEHIHLHRQEALKILHPFLQREHHFVSRFRREARAINRLQHPNIVSVFDFGELPDGRFYLAMEYADGPSLASTLAKSGKVSVQRALHLLIQLAGAIDHAHGRGVIHRDLKPDNLVVVERGSRRDVLKVLDFGIAKIVADDYRESLIATPVGDIFGTLAYLAPEVLSGQPAGAAADLYAFGCIAFELVTGRPPFEGSKMDTVQGHLTRPPPSPAARNGDVPPKLAEIIELCLKKDPGERAPSAAHILTLLAQVTLSPPRREDRSDDWEPIDTAESRPSETADAHAMTESIDPDDYEEPVVRYRRLVTALVGQIIDAGQGDISLVAGLARVREHEDELSQNAAESARIERALDELEQAARAREGKLRFALGELQFERMRAADAGTGVAEQIARIEERLAGIAAASERERDELLEKAIALAARRADLEAELDDECRDIEAHASRCAEAPRNAVTEIRGLREILDRQTTIKMR